MNYINYLGIFKNVLESESKAILDASGRVKNHEIQGIIGIFEMLFETGGSLIFSGVGKSGIVARKFSSTFTSLGLPSFFLHPTEALHGDLGRVTKADALVMVSKSGATEELLKLYPYLPMDPSMMIGLLGRVPSPLAEKCGVILDCTVEKEACLHNQAPTTSTVVTMAMGDAMAVIYESLVGLSKEKFALGHPGGILGKTLRLKVKDLMIEASRCPTLSAGSTFQEVILKMTEIPLGICVVLDKDNGFKGIVVEGDIRRTFSGKQNAALGLKVEEVMNTSPVMVGREVLAHEALNLMEKRKTPISVLPVVEDGNFYGVIRLHDLLKEGLLPSNDPKDDKIKGSR